MPSLRSQGLAAALVLACALTACQGPAIPAPSASSPSEAPATWLTGYVRMGEGVAGATVRLVDADGKALGEPLTTNAHGQFSRSAEGLPRRFKVLAEGGRLSGQPFEGQLEALVEGLSARNSRLWVSVASTLASRLASRDPGLASSERWAQVATTLGFPKGSEGEAMSVAFQEETFLVEAKAKGGVGPYLDELTQGLGRPGALSYEEREVKLVAGVFAKWMGEQLAGALVGQLAGMGLGEVLGALGLGEPSNAEVMAAIEQLAAEIRALSFAIQDLSVQMQAGFANTQYLTKAGQLDELIAKNESLSQSLQDLLAMTAVGQKPDTDPNGQVAKRIADVRSQLVAVDALGLAYWHNALMGTGASPGLIELFSKSVAANNPNFYGAREAGLVEAWWQYMDAQQALTLNLLCEYRKLAGGDPKPLLQRWRDNRVAQLQKLRGCVSTTDSLDLSAAGLGKTDTQLYALPPGVVRQQGTDLMWGTIDFPLQDATGILDRTKRLVSQSGFSDWKPATLTQILTLADAGRGAYFVPRLQSAGMAYNGYSLLVGTDSVIPLPLGVKGYRACVNGVGAKWVKAWEYQAATSYAVRLVGGEKPYWY